MVSVPIPPHSSHTLAIEEFGTEKLVIIYTEVISSVYPAWQRFIDTSAMQIQQRSNDIDLASEIFKYGVELINSIPALIKKTLGPVNLEDEDKWNPIVLPEFKEEKGDL